MSPNNNSASAAAPAHPVQQLKQQLAATTTTNTNTNTNGPLWAIAAGAPPALKARALSDESAFPGLAALSARVRKDLQILSYPSRPWVPARTHPATGAKVYDVVIVGGGQCGLTTAFALQQEKVNNVLVLDENPAGLEGPWVTYARMVTLRTSKLLTGPDLGVPSLTFQSYYEAKFGEPAFQALDKIPKEEWMAYLLWYRDVLQLPVRNNTRVELIEPEPAIAGGGGFKVTLSSTAAAAAGAGDADGSSGDDGDDGSGVVYARKVVLATGIQGGGEWHVPSVVRDGLRGATHLYAHTCQPIDFEALRGKRVAVLGGGASAFDNAQHCLERGAGEVVVYVRRKELPRVNPIRCMEYAGFLNHFSDLDDATKYAGIDFFLQYQQPPTNDTFCRAARFDNFRLRTGAPWEKVAPAEESDCNDGNTGRQPSKLRIFTPQGDEGLFDFAIISTGLLTDVSLRPELRAVAARIATWRDKLEAGEVALPEGAKRNALIDAHPYLGPSFEFTPRGGGGGDDEAAGACVRSIFCYNYAALPSLGLSGSALSGMKFAVRKLAAGITRQLFLDDRDHFVGGLLSYDTEEFLQTWPLADDVRASLRAKLDGGGESGTVAAQAPAAVVAV